MGAYYEIDEDTGEIVYQDESTGWQVSRFKMSVGQRLQAQAMSDKFWDEWAALLKSMTQTALAADKETP